MATNSTTTALIVGAGALADYIMRGEWTARSFIVSAGGAVTGFFVAMLITYYIPAAYQAPETVQWAIIYFCGFFAHPIVRRINKMTVKASVAGVEVQSQGEDK